MTNKRGDKDDRGDNLPETAGKAKMDGESGQKAASSAKNKLISYTKQLASLGLLQQAIVVNIQKEIDNID